MNKLSLRIAFLALGSVMAMDRASYAQPPAPSNTPTPTITDTPSNTPTPTITNTPSNTPTPTITDTPSNTPTATITNTPSTAVAVVPTLNVSGMLLFGLLVAGAGLLLLVRRR